MQFHSNQTNAQLMSDQINLAKGNFNMLQQKRSRKNVGHAPIPLLKSRVSRRGLPCPEEHDTPEAASQPFPCPAVVTEEDFEGFILVDNQREIVRRQRRRARRASRALAEGTL